LLCIAQEQIVRCDSTITTYNKEHVALLHRLIKNAKSSKGDEKVKFEKQFFCVMPNSFENMLNLLFLEATITFNTAKANGELPPLTLVHPFVSFFNGLESIEPDSYYEKYINICVGGFYGADDIREGFQIHKRFESDTKAICKVLVKRNDKDIQSVFRFIFDSSHPDNEYNREIYSTIHPLITKENKRLGELLKLTFEKLKRDKKHH